MQEPKGMQFERYYSELMSDRTLCLVAKTPKRMHLNKTELENFSSHGKTR